MNALPTFELVKSEMKLVYQKACLMRTPKIDERISLQRNLSN